MKLFVFAAVALASISFAGAADLNTPLDEKPTLGTEINRGQQAAFECAIHHPADASAASDCVFRTAAVNAQQLANAAPFDIGLYYGLWMNLRACRLAFGDAPSGSQQAAELANCDHERDTMYVLFREKRKQLGLSDEQIVRANKEFGENGFAPLVADLQRWNHSWPVDPDTGKKIAIAGE